MNVNKRKVFLILKTIHSDWEKLLLLLPKTFQLLLKPLLLHLKPFLCPFPDTLKTFPNTNSDCLGKQTKVKYYL